MAWRGREPDPTTDPAAPDVLAAYRAAGDTRMAGCREHNPSGQCKTVFYAPIFSALARWAALSGDQRYAQASYRVWLRSHYGG